MRLIDWTGKPLFLLEVKLFGNSGLNGRHEESAARVHQAEREKLRMQFLMFRVSINQAADHALIWHLLFFRLAFEKL